MLSPSGHCCKYLFTDCGTMLAACGLAGSVGVASTTNIEGSKWTCDFREDFIPQAQVFTILSSPDKNEVLVDAKF